MNDKLQKLTAGSMIAHRADHPEDWLKVVAALQSSINELELPAYSIKTSMTESGPDLGSESFPLIEPLRVAMLAGTGTEVASAGGLWFTFDRLLDIPCARIEPNSLSATGLARYTSLFVSDGETSRLAGTPLKLVRDWVRNGGHLILIGGAVASAKAMIDEEGNSKNAEPLVPRVEGVILKATLGTNTYWNQALGRKMFPVFQSDAIWPIDRGAILRLDQSPLLAGYLPESAESRIAGQTVFGQSNVGKGLVTSMTFDPTFRAHYWSTIPLLGGLLLQSME
jgi:hypothetical protein